MIKKAIFCIVLCLIIFTGVGSGEGIIYGYVKDENGNPLEGATINVFESENGTGLIASTTTDINGFYLITLYNGTYDVYGIRGQEPGIYKIIKVDYFRDMVVYRKVKIMDNSEIAVDFFMDRTPWNLITFMICVILGIISFDQICLKYGIPLRETIKKAWMELKNMEIYKKTFRKTAKLWNSVAQSSEGILIGALPHLRSFTKNMKYALPYGKNKTHHGISSPPPTSQKRCPITKLRLEEIPANKLYKCSCNTYYHYDSIKKPPGEGKCMICKREVKEAHLVKTTF